jgi:hypothetical protein
MHRLSTGIGPAREEIAEGVHLEHEVPPEATLEDQIDAGDHGVEAPRRIGTMVQSVKPVPSRDGGAASGCGLGSCFAGNTGPAIGMEKGKRNPGCGGANLHRDLLSRLSNLSIDAESMHRADNAQVSSCPGHDLTERK